MSGLRPLSDITERLQSLAKSKHDNSLFTGSEFVDEYGTSGQPLESEPNRTIATAGGDLQNAYSKVNSVYRMAKNANKNGKSKFKVKGEATPSLNTHVLVADLNFAVQHLQTAHQKLADHDISIAGEVKSLIDDIEAHKQKIDQTGMVVLE
jgi:hypothetical protein